MSKLRLWTHDLDVNLISRLAFASVGLCLIFPSFLKNVRRLGANAEVLERLHFFSEMNEIRTACRLVYSICFVSFKVCQCLQSQADIRLQLIISADAFTAEKRVNKSQFWSDTLYLSGQLGLFCATCLSVVVSYPGRLKVVNRD